MKEVWLVFSAMVCFSLAGPIADAFAGKDDSDSEDSRSGVTPRIDHLTGCQYLTTPRGSITPRLRKDGTQVCL